MNPHDLRHIHVKMRVHHYRMNGQPIDMCTCLLRITFLFLIFCIQFD
jgi:hypothetical protein